MVFSLIFQARQQRPTGIGLRLGEPALFGLHPRLAHDHEIDALQHLAFGRRVFLSEDTFDRGLPAQLGLAIGSFGFTELPPRLENEGAVMFDVGLPGLPGVGVTGAPAGEPARPGLLQECEAATQVCLGLLYVSRLNQKRGNLTVGAEQEPPRSLHVGVADLLLENCQ
jgi:hypothetical protein